jgi:hypothetical protein
MAQHLFFRILVEWMSSGFVDRCPGALASSENIADFIYKCIKATGMGRLTSSIFKSGFNDFKRALPRCKCIIDGVWNTCTTHSPS